MTSLSRSSHRPLPPAATSLNVPRSQRVSPAIQAVAFALCVALPTARANVVTVNGVPVTDNSPNFILVNPGAGSTVVTIDTQNLTGAVVDSLRVNGTTGITQLTVNVGRTITGASNAGVNLNSTTASITALINGSVMSAQHGLIMDSRGAADGGNLVLSGNGALGSAGSTGVGAWLLTDTGTVTVNGFQAIHGRTFGLLINSNNSNSGTTAGGAINIGTTTPLGAVTAAAGTGIHIEQSTNLTGDGAINLVATSVLAVGGTGIRSIGQTGAADIKVTGLLTSTGHAGIHATATSGNIRVHGGGTGNINGGAEGIFLDTSVAPAGGNLTVESFASITGATTGVRMATDTGMISLNGVGSISGNGGRGVLASATGGTINIGTTTSNGAIMGQSVGVETSNTSGDTNIVSNDLITGMTAEGILSSATAGKINIIAKNVSALGGAGIRTIGGTGDTDIKVSGVLDATGNGIQSSSSGGSVTASGNGTGVIQGGLTAIVLDSTAASAGGNLVVRDFSSVTGAEGIKLLSNVGSITVDGVSSVVGNTGPGILATSTSGAILVGTNLANGPITGRTNGIETSTGGNTHIVTTASVIGTTGKGIFSTSPTGNITISAASVTAGTHGIHTVGGTGATDVTLTGALTAVGSGILSTTTSGSVAIQGTNTGSIHAGMDGINVDTSAAPAGGTITVKDLASVRGGENGIRLIGDTGLITVDKISSITGVAGNGLMIATKGAVNIGQGTPLGTITGGLNGIVVTQTLDALNNGDIKIGVTNITANNGDGIRTTAFGANTQITASGTITATGDGIESSSTSGGIMASGGGTGIINASGSGIVLDSSAPANGDLSVSGFNRITGAQNGVQITADGGITSVNGNGPIIGTNGTGILANNTGGTINIGTTSPNGAITGKLAGIDTTNTSGGTHINTSSPVTATAGNGIKSTSTSGELDIRAVNVSATSGIGVLTNTLSGATGVIVSGLLNSTGNGIQATTASGNITVGGAGTGIIQSGGLGLLLDGGVGTPGGNLTVENLGSVTGGTGGIKLIADTGSSNINGIGSVTATTGNGIQVGSLGGGIHIGTTSPNGPINGQTNGILASNTSGATNITTNAAVTGTTGSGIKSSATTGAVTIDQKAGTITGGTTGIDTATTTGPTTITTNANVTGGSGAGVNSTATGGSLSINQMAGTIIGADGVKTNNTTGTTNVVAGGNITGTTGNGIDSTSTSGHVTVEQRGTGTIIGEVRGVDIATGSGNTNVIATGQITGKTGDGVEVTSTSGNISVETRGTGTIIGAVRGIDVSTGGNGNIAITVATGTKVEGTENGIVSSTANGTATVNNNGTVKGGNGTAIINSGGNLVLNNAGMVDGQVRNNGSGTLTVNNLVDGVWTPSTSGNNFGGSSVLNNAGTMRVAGGVTNLTGITGFNNQSGGVVDLTTNAAATDSLVTPFASTKRGSSLRVNFDSVAPNNSGLGFDHSSSGQGTADTVVVTNPSGSTPEASSTIDVVHNGAPIPTHTGSVAVIYTGVNRVAPNPGDYVSDSAYYSLGTLADTAAVDFHLVDDGNGGVYLQWTPQLNAATLGAFMGGDLRNPTQAPSSMASIAGQIGTIAGAIGFNGGPSGGGVLGHVNDATRDTYMRPIAQGDTDNSPTASEGNFADERLWDYWAITGGASNSFETGNTGSYGGIAIGIERDLSAFTGMENGRSALGVFGMTNHSTNEHLSGSTDTSSNGVGTFVRGGWENGIYGSLQSTLAWQDSTYQNKIFGTDAAHNSITYSGSMSVGYAHMLSSKTQLDLRAFGSYGNNGGGSFTDTKGLPINAAASTMLTVGTMSGIHHRVNQHSSIGLRAGVKHVSLSREVAVGATKMESDFNLFAASLELTARARIARRTTLDLNTYSDFGKYFQSLGGSVGVTVNF